MADYNIAKRIEARNYLQQIYYEILSEIDVESVEAFEYSSCADTSR